MKDFKINIMLLLLTLLQGVVYSQGTVPLGINYQAVARDNFGKELANTTINVKFSIIYGNPDGAIVYQEIHQNIITSKYGVFNIVIGNGAISGNSIYQDLAELEWDKASHYLKVEVKFANDYLDMGTMQFLAVPYAMYAQKSLEPGPQGIQGLKGDPGDPASDDQTLSFDGTNLSISVGDGDPPSTVNLSTLNIPHQLSILGDTLSILGGNKVGLPNQIQNLILDDNNILKIDKNPDATPINLTRFLDDKQTLTFTPAENKVYISGGNSIDLTPLKQDLQLDENILTITNSLSPTEIDMSAYLQQLSFSDSDNKLSIGGGNTVDLAALKDDADSSPTNEIQDLELTGDMLKVTNNSSATSINLGVYKDNTDNQSLGYNAETYSLTLTGSSPVSIGSLIAFRAEKTIAAGTTGAEVTLIFDEESYDDGSAYDNTSGEYIVPVDGIYTFNVRYDAALGAKVSIYLNGDLYERVADAISSSAAVYRSITMKLVAGNKVKVVVNTGMATETGTGSFSGFRVY